MTFEELENLKGYVFSMKHGQESKVLVYGENNSAFLLMDNGTFLLYNIEKESTIITKTRKQTTHSHCVICHFYSLEENRKFKYPVYLTDEIVSFRLPFVPVQ